VVLNPGSGGSTAWIRDILRRRLGDEAQGCRIHESEPDQDLGALVREAVEQGAEVLVAAGGDGTVSAVAAGLLGSEAALGIVPLGTANVLAREFGLPLDPDGACRLIAGDHAVIRLDAMIVEGRPYLTHVGVGLDALMIRDTDRASKRRLGRLAYLRTALARLAGFQPRRFLIQVDDESRRLFRASEVLVANVGTLGQRPFRWGPGIQPDDGVLNVCAVRARSLLDYLRLAWNVLRGAPRPDPSVRYLTARRRVRIAMKRAEEPLPAQADGELVGETPIEVELRPAAVKVIAPPEATSPEPDRPAQQNGRGADE